MRYTRTRYVIVVTSPDDPGHLVGIVGPYLDVDRARAERARWRTAGYHAAVRTLRTGAELRREQRERAHLDRV